MNTVYKSFSRLVNAHLVFLSLQCLLLIPR